MAKEDFISISIVVWEQKMAAYVLAMKNNMREALYEEWPFLMRKIMDFTPPFKAKGQPSISDLSIGRKAVSTDIYKTMRPFDPAQIKTKQMQKIIDRKDFAAFTVIAARSTNPYLKGSIPIAFSPEVHLRARDRRGRVTGKDRKRVVFGGDVALLKSYVTKIQGRVGYAKSGWLKALLLVGGAAPGYVSKQGTGGGDVIDDHANEDEPSITAINRTPWAVRKDEGARIMTDAYFSRAKAIELKIQAKARLGAKEARLAA